MLIIQAENLEGCQMLDYYAIGSDFMYALINLHVDLSPRRANIRIHKRLFISLAVVDLLTLVALTRLFLSYRYIYRCYSFCRQLLSRVEARKSGGF